MPTPCISNPYLHLAAYALGKPIGWTSASDIEYAEKVVAEVLDQDPLLLPHFLKKYPNCERGGNGITEAEAEGLLRCLWRGDYQRALKVASGPYLHFKGNRYLVYGEGVLLQGPKEEPAVVYANTEGKIFIRPLKEWIEIVKWPDGSYNPRFLPVKP